MLSSLAGGPLRKAIEDAGGLKLVYIDPPFDVGADFRFEPEAGDETLTKEPSVIEDIAYRDTWGRGTDSFVSMIHERLGLIQSIMAPDATLFIHIGWAVSHLVKLTADELLVGLTFKIRSFGNGKQRTVTRVKELPPWLNT